MKRILTLDDEVFVGFLNAPNDNGSVQASRGHQRRIRTPRDAIDFSSVEAPLILFGNNLNNQEEQLRTRQNLPSSTNSFNQPLQTNSITIHKINGTMHLCPFFSSDGYIN